MKLVTLVLPPRPSPTAKPVQPERKKQRKTAPTGFVDRKRGGGKAGAANF